MNMAKDCAQQRQAALNVFAIAVPLQQDFAGISVPKMPDPAFAAEYRARENAERRRVSPNFRPTC